MKLDARHHYTIQLLIDHRFTGKTKLELAKDIGIQDRTLRKWIADPTFRVAYDEALGRWLKDLEGIRFRHRKERIMELQRLYDVTPDSYIEKVIRIDADAVMVVDEQGKVLMDADGKPVSGKPVSVLTVRRLNVGEKREILKQIKEEVEPSLMRWAGGTRDKDGNEQAIYFEVGAPPEGEGKKGEAGMDIPWGDPNAILPMGEERGEK